MSLLIEALAVQTSAAIDYIKLVHKSESDLICFGFLNSETKKFQQAFRSLDDAIQPEFCEKLQNTNQVNSVYMSLNSFKSPERKTANVAFIRSVGLDLDKDGRANLNKLFETKLIVEPNIVFETSPDKFQAIWTVENISVEQAERISKALAAEFGGDPAATDAARVMRLPGFRNCKYPEKPEVEVVHLADRTDRLSLDAFKIILDKQSVVETKPSTSPAVSDERKRVARGNHDTTLTIRAGQLLRDYVPKDLAIEILTREVEELYDDAGSDYREMVIKCVRSIYKHPAGPGAPTTLIGGKRPGEAVAPSAQPKAVPADESWPPVGQLDDKLSPVLPFTADYLPSSICPWVEDVSERMSVPMDFAGISALATIAGVLGRRVFVYPKAKDKEWKESIALSGAVVASSGKTKTPTWKTFINVVVEKETDWRTEHQLLVQKHLEDVEKWEALKKRNKKTGEENEGSEDLPPTPEEPVPCRRLMLNDATPEKMHDVMRTNPGGLFYYRDELSSWVAELDKEGREVQRGLFLAAMNGDDAYSIDRIGREGGFAIMCCSVFGGFQPELLREFLSNTRNVDDGMIPRFPLIVWPDEVELPLVDRIANDDAKQKYRRIIRDLSEMKEKQVSMHFSPEAQGIFDGWLADLSLKVSAEKHSGKRSHLSKYKGALPKIAALLQIVDLVGNGELYGTHQIDAAHLRKALGLLEYLESHMHRVYDCIRTSIQKAEAALAKRITDQDLKSGFTERSVRRKGWRDLSNSDCIELASESLAERGWLREIPQPPNPGRGRPTTKWEINPSLIKIN